MNQKEITSGLVSYFRSDQWQELMRLLTQTEEEIYHIHLHVENSVDGRSLARLIDRYFKQKGMELERKLDLVPMKSGAIVLHGIHPQIPGRDVYTPSTDILWQYNPAVVLKPADPAKGEDGQNIIGWGKSYMQKWLKQFDLKVVGPKEEKEIVEYFHSAHWKKFIRLAEDPRYLHVHANLEISFDPWFFKIFAMEAFREIGWQVEHAISCVFITPKGYLGKLSFLTVFPEDMLDVAWVYNPDVVIRPARDGIGGLPPEDGDLAFDVCTRSQLDVLSGKGKYQSLTDKQIEEILAQV